jgi:hypothetical protein
MKNTIFLVINFITLAKLADQMFIILFAELVVIIIRMMAKTERKIRLPTLFRLRRKVLVPMK